MRRRETLYVAAYLLIGTVAVLTVSGQEPDATPQQTLQSSPSASQESDSQTTETQRNVPKGKVQQISDWALAGVVWSDASLAKKLAVDALRKIEDRESIEAKQLQQVIEDSERMINNLKKFGWKQTQKRTSVAKVPAGSSQARGDTGPNLGVNRLDQETPIGRDDPGVDDEIDNPETPVDIEQYRVDDVIDERPSEARNLADALEDGAEEAIAAASGRPTIGGDVAGYISQRELTTRSATLPYSADSIYDRDDYDPDVDYDVENPAGIRATNPETVGLSDGDDDVEKGGEIIVAEGEDEVLASSARNSSQSTASVGNPSPTSISRFSTDAKRYAEDADWVQMHLDANQLLYTQLSTRDDMTQSAIDALSKLRASALVARRATGNSDFRAMLEPVLELRIKR